MPQRVAVRSFEDMITHFDKLRRDTLFFDRLAVSELSAKTEAWASKDDYTSVEPQRLAALRWLVDQGILFDPNTRLDDPDLIGSLVHRDYINIRAAVQHHLETLIVRVTGNDTPTVVDANRMEVNAGLSVQECNTRIDAALMRRNPSVNALALLPAFPGPVLWRQTALTDVMRIAVAGWPVPADSVGWQTVQELRADSESKATLEQLRTWINDVATIERPLRQILEAFKDLSADYHRYLHARGITVRFCSFGTVVVVSRQIGEGFTQRDKLKTNLMRIRYSREALLESEMGETGTWVMHYEPFHMSHPLSETDVERLSSTQVSVADERSLREYYERDAFVRTPSLNQLQAEGLKASRRRRKINHWADKAYQAYSPAVKNRLTVADNRKKFKESLEEHAQASTELLGDYPRKLKKWALYAFSDYAEQLADVAFAAFRLDDLNARALLLPTGTPAVIVNTSTLTSVPFIVAAFMGLYDRLFAIERRSPEADGPELGFVLELARAFASRNYEEVTRLQKGWASTYGLNYYHQIIFSWGLFVAFHECAHIILDHLRSPNVAATEMGGMKFNRRRELEFAADEFAIRNWLFLDPEPDLDHAFTIAATCTCVFAFFQLVSNISSERIDSHPQATYRWTAVRPHLLAVNGAEPLVKNFEEMIQIISTVQQYT